MPSLATEVGIDANSPQVGYYKEFAARAAMASCHAHFGTTQKPVGSVAIWTAAISTYLAIEIWPYAANKPVSREDYAARLKEKWPGEHAAVIGHNSATGRHSGSHRGLHR